MIILLALAVWTVALLVGLLAGRFWAIVRTKGMISWPFAYVPLWLTPNKLYLLTGLEICGLLAGFVLTFISLGIVAAIVAAALFFPLKHILVAAWMRSWFLTHGRDESNRDVLDMFDDEPPK